MIKKEIQQYFKSIKFDEMSQEEKIEQNKKAFKRLQDIPKGDYDEVRRILRIIEGRGATK